MINSETRFGLKSPWLMFGIFMFIFNRVLDMTINLPVGDILLPLFAFAFVYRDGETARIVKSPGLYLTLLLLLWLTVSNIANGIGFGGQFRNTFAVATLFFPVIFFMAARDRNPLMAYFIGNIIGFGLYFLYHAGMDLSQGGFSRALRSDLFTPAVPLALYFMFRRNITPALAVTLVGLTAAGSAVAMLIEARGAVLSIIMGAGIYVAARVSPWPKLTLPLIVIFGFAAHYISSFFVADSLDAVMQSGNDTVSNMERAYAIDYSRMVLEQSPWFGFSPQSYVINFADFFRFTAGFGEEGDKIASPHNTFLEYGVFFGYPAAILITLLTARFVQAGMVTKEFARSFAVALACAGIIRQAALYGLSGILRVEWFALILLILYFYEYKPAPKAAEPLPLRKYRMPRQPQQPATR